MPSCAGILSSQQEPSSADVEMDDGAAKMRYISGYSDLGFKRDHMKIQALYQEDGTSK